ncbi:MAG: hypothetical protein ACYCOU_16705 [Sulfobacillus sp.]
MWFDKETLDQMSRPTMDRVIEKIQAGELDDAIKICGEMKREWGFLHDLMVESMAALLTYIGQAQGEDHVGDALRYMTEKVWKDAVDEIGKRDRRQVAMALAATWRAHSTSGVGPKAGAFSVEEDDDKLTFTMAPCGSGQRLWRRGFYDPPKSYGLTEKPHQWSFNRKDFPYYCSHCTLMNELMPIEWTGTPLYPLDPPQTPDHWCTWYFYKDPEQVPERFYTRYGLNKSEELAKHRRPTPSGTDSNES